MPGREGGFLAILAFTYGWFDSHQPDKILTTPLEMADTTDDEHTTYDDDDPSDGDDGWAVSGCADLRH